MTNDYLQATEPPKQFNPRKLTLKQKRFVKHLIDNPKSNPTKAALEVYGKEGKEISYGTANQIGFDNLRKPSIVMALGEHADLFEGAIVGVVQRWKDSEAPRKAEIALDAAKFGHDKIFGKSTVKIEQQTSIVQIAINLTGDGEEPPIDL